MYILRVYGKMDFRIEVEVETKSGDRGRDGGSCCGPAYKSVMY